MLCEPRIHAFIGVDRVWDIGLQAAGAYSWCDAFLNYLAPALYAQHFGSPLDANGILTLSGALREMDQDSEGG